MGFFSEWHRKTPSPTNPRLTLRNDNRTSPFRKLDLFLFVDTWVATACGFLRMRNYHINRTMWQIKNTETAASLTNHFEFRAHFVLPAYRAFAFEPNIPHTPIQSEFADCIWPAIDSLLTQNSQALAPCAWGFSTAPRTMLSLIPMKPKTNYMRELVITESVIY